MKVDVLLDGLQFWPPGQYPQPCRGICLYVTRCHADPLTPAPSGSIKQDALPAKASCFCLAHRWSHTSSADAAAHDLKGDAVHALRGRGGVLLAGAAQHQGWESSKAAGVR